MIYHICRAGIEGENAMIMHHIRDEEGEKGGK
jgi:hypothetical protein